MATRSIIVFISGNGSNLQALIDAVESNGLKDTRIALVVSNRKSAYGLVRAEKHAIPTLYFPLKPYKDQGKSRQEYDHDLGILVHQRMMALGYTLPPQVIVLAGWMHIFTPSFLNQFPEPTTHIMNLHPALPGQFDGANAIERAFEAFQHKQITHTGVMVHKVIPQVDQGQVICQSQVDLYETDTLQDVQERIHSIEHHLIVKGLALLFEEIERSE